MQYRQEYSAKGAADEIEVKLVGYSGTDSDFVGYIHRITLLHQSGSATTWDPTVFDASGASAGGDHEIVGISSASVATRVNESMPIPVMFYSESGSLFVKLGFDAGSDNDGILELYISRADAGQRT